jgi:hypothetical protein
MRSAINRSANEATQLAESSGVVFIGQGSVVPTESGLNRFVWDMRYPDAAGIDGGTYLFGGSLRGPKVAPGEYKVKITVGDQTANQSFEIRKDPRAPTTDDDYRKQLAFLLAVRDRVSAANEAVTKIHLVQGQVGAVLQKAGTDTSLVNAGHQLSEALNVESEQLYQPRFTGFDDQTLAYPLKLNNRLAALQSYGQGDYPPTEQDVEVLAELSRELDQTLAKLKQILDVDLSAFNAKLKAAGFSEVSVSRVEVSSKN